MTNRFTFFNKFIFRTPVLPLTSWDTSFVNTPIFKEALYLASRDLFEVAKIDHENNFQSVPAKVQFSLLKYLLRMSSRCTPFGLFAACGIGEIDPNVLETKVVFEGKSSFRTVTKLDMDFAAMICKMVADNKLFKEKLKFYPNNTLYKVGRQYRYIDFKYVNKARKYLLSEIESNDYLIQVLEFAKEGVIIDDIVQFLTANNELQEEEIRSFLADIIDNQILTNELYLNVTGNDPVDRLIGFLSRPDVASSAGHLLSFFDSIISKMKDIDSQHIGRNIDQYVNIENKIKAIGVNYNPSCLFQSDMYINNPVACVGATVMNSVLEGFNIINKLTMPQVPLALKKFKENFYKRYEDEEVSLAEVLDTDIGIGFSNLLPELSVHNPLLENIVLGNKAEIKDLTLNRVEYILLKKYHDFLREGLSEIILTDNDVADLPENWDDLPSTMATMVEIIGNNDENKEPLIAMDAFGGPSATNLMTRFAKGNNAIMDLVAEVIKKEEENLAPGQILAEIVHLPESRTGNILFRPVLRKYEIPYLAIPGVEPENAIPISDLMVSLSFGKLKLRSASLNKEILPRLSSAHNFPHNSLPVYHFLCLMQSEGLRPNLYFSWGTVLKEEKFLPRLRYKSVVLSPATWIIETTEINHLFNWDSKEFIKDFEKFRTQKKLPERVLISDSDNKLYINFNDHLSVKLFLNELKKKKMTRVEEFLFDDSPGVIQDSSGGKYVNQFLFCFYKNQ